MIGKHNGTDEWRVGMYSYIYHVVELLRWPPHEVIDWCDECYGSKGERWFTMNNKIYFAEQRDRTMFLLRWL